MQKVKEIFEHSYAIKLVKVEVNQVFVGVELQNQNYVKEQNLAFQIIWKDNFSWCLSLLVLCQLERNGPQIGSGTKTGALGLILIQTK